MRTLPLALIAALVLALAAGGCGGSSSTTATTGASPTASAPDATAPPTDATQPGTNPVTTRTTPRTSTKPQTTSIPQYSSTTSSGAVRTRVPASFAIEGGKLVPAGISAPAKLPIDITVVSKDGKPHKLLLEIPPKPRTLGVAASGRLVVELPGGLPAGTYGIELDGHVAGGLVIGRKPGP